MSPPGWPRKAPCCSFSRVNNGGWSGIFILLACSCAQAPRGFEPEQGLGAPDAGSSTAPSGTCGGFYVALSCPDAGEGGTCESPAPSELTSDGVFPLGCTIDTDNGVYGADGACVVPTWTCQGSPPRWVETHSTL